VPAAGTYGIAVGGGFSEATARQVVRTANNTVYVVAADDNVCQGGGRAVIRVWKGTGAQPGNANVPTGFAEQDSAHHPVASGNADCTYTFGVAATLGNPDLRLDKSGLIQLAYIDGGTGNVYYQTYSTSTDSWGARTVIGSGASVSDGRSWPRQGQIALSLDTNDQPMVVYPTAGTSNTLAYTKRGTSGWSAPAAVASGTNLMHPSMVTSRDGTLQLAWLDNSLATHARVEYARYNGSSWSTPELVSNGDASVLANNNGDQGPSIAADTSNRPSVLYLDGTPAGSDDYVRMRYRTSGGSWTDNTPPAGAGGASNPNATLFAHTPQNYIAANNDTYVFLGHDVNIQFGYQYQSGGAGSAWGPYTTLDPRSKTNPAPGDTCEPGTDGSASIRFDPLRDNNPGIIDVLYYDERDNSDCSHHHATLYYKAIVIK
jgi:hypothetical protein